MPDADGALPSADRAQAAGIYSGIAIGTPPVVLHNLKIMSLKLDDLLSLSVSIKGDCIPISLISSAPSGAPPSGRGLVMYVSGGVLKLAAWNGVAWVTT